MGRGVINFLSRGGVVKSISFCFLFFLTSCGYNNTSLPTETSKSNLGINSSRSKSGNGISNSEVDPHSNPTFADIQQYLFEPYCLSCHSETTGNRAGVNLETFQNVSLNAPRILEAIESGRMPLTGSLPSESINLFKKWIDNGMPAGGIQ